MMTDEIDKATTKIHLKCCPTETATLFKHSSELKKIIVMFTISETEDDVITYYNCPVRLDIVKQLNSLLNLVPKVTWNVSYVNYNLQGQDIHVKKQFENEKECYEQYYSQNQNGNCKNNKKRYHRNCIHNSWKIYGINVLHNNYP